MCVCVCVCVRLCGPVRLISALDLYVLCDFTLIFKTFKLWDGTEGVKIKTIEYV